MNNMQTDARMDVETIEHVEVLSVLLLNIYDVYFFFSSRRRHTRSVSAFLLNRSSDLHSFPSWLPCWSDWSSYYHFNYSGYRWRLLRDGRRWRSPSFSIASWPCY